MVFSDIVDQWDVIPFILAQTHVGKIRDKQMRWITLWLIKGKFRLRFCCLNDVDRTGQRSRQMLCQEVVLEHLFGHNKQSI